MKTKRGMSAWYGFDLDGTLAHHESGDSIKHVGLPIARTVALVKKLLAAGEEVRIVTARVSPEWNDQAEQIAMIEAWCLEHIGQKLPVQAHKNGGMITLYDDRAVGLQRNTGVPLHELHLQIDRSVTVARIKHVFHEQTGIEMDPKVAAAIAESIHVDIQELNL